jgi:putative membrane protein
MNETNVPGDDAAVRAITRPHPNLLKLYMIQSLAGTIFAPLVFLPLYFKYHTLKYKLDEEGVSASWGILFKREIYLTYRRIQDIHVSRNVFERWLGIGKVELQTASGSSSAELALEGMERHHAVRDYLYARMRGARGEPAKAAPQAGDQDVAGAIPRGGESEVVLLLRSIQGELEGVRRALEAPRSGA